MNFPAYLQFISWGSRFFLLRNAPLTYYFFRKVGKRKAPAKAAGKGKAKAVKDPNKPKRPPNAFFVFLSRNLKTMEDDNIDDENMELTPELGSIYADMEMMKERFTKMLLGEDMLGGGKGVSSAVALSNAVTNLAASVFGEFSRLEPMQPDSKERWRKEIDWLVSVTDHIVEFVPSKQSTNGITMEIMITRQRSDVSVNILALKKLDGMLMECLDNFKDQNEFTYVTKDGVGSKSSRKRDDDKWSSKVPPNGLPDITRKWLQFQKDSANQVLKAALAMNAHILTEMEIPESYIDGVSLRMDEQA